MAIEVVSRGQLSSLSSTSPVGPGWVVDPGIPLLDYIPPNGSRISPLDVWKTQPSVRKVVDFIARAIASTPLKLYERVSDTDRKRVTDHPLSRVLRLPAPRVIPFRFWHSIMVDWLLFDRWCALKAANTNPLREIDLVRIRAARFKFGSDGLDRVNNVLVDGGKKSGGIDLDPEQCLYDHGYAPKGSNGTTPMQTLCAILEEDVEAVKWRRSVWKRGARVPLVIERPIEAPEWSETAQRRFERSWRQYSAGGGSEGGTPLLEDGMHAQEVKAFSPQDAQDIQGRQFSDAMVASAFHIAPELVGAREGTYSNVQAYREMLYRDGLGAAFVAWEQVLNAMLVPDFDDSGNLYIEADIDAKLRGSFEQQAKIGSTAVGRPWMKTNEFRARMNLPAVDGGDELVTPLNVVIGGQPSPRAPLGDGSDNENSRRPGGQKMAITHVARIKADSEEEHNQELTELLKKFFGRQKRALAGVVGKALPSVRKKADGDPEWWDGDRWNNELADDLFALAMKVTQQVASKVLDGLGISPDEYDPDRTVEFLKQVMWTRSAMINGTTRDQIKAMLEDVEGDQTLDDLFTTAEQARAPQSGATIATTLAAFATTESVKQVAPERSVKTWVTGSNPRPAHAMMNGETVGIDEKFSNGATWPGDPILGAEGVSGCNCTIQVDIS